MLPVPDCPWCYLFSICADPCLRPPRGICYVAPTKAIQKEPEYAARAPCCMPPCHLIPGQPCQGGAMQVAALRLTAATAAHQERAEQGGGWVSLALHPPPLAQGLGESPGARQRAGPAGGRETDVGTY